MEQMNITLNKEEISKPFVINQYSKNFNYKLNIFNSDGTPYTFKPGDYIVMEVAINNIAIILSGVDFSIVGNVATFNIPRELTLNSGKGTYNVSIVNDSDNSRIACFSKEIVVKSNSIDEDTVSTDLIVTAIEDLNNATSNANSKLTELNTAIGNADLEKFAEKTEVNTRINIVENDLANKRDKSTKIKSSDLDTSADSNKIKQINLSEEVLQQMAGNTPINAVPADSSITTEKLVDGAITSNKMFRGIGTLILMDAIEFNMNKKKVTFLKSPYMVDKSATKIANKGDTIDIPTFSANTTIALYYDLISKTVGVNNVGLITNPHLILMTHMVGTENFNLYTNKNGILYYNTYNYRKYGGEFRNTFGNVSDKINITIEGNTLGVELKRNPCSVYVDGILVLANSVGANLSLSSLNKVVNLLLDTSTKQIFLKEVYDNINLIPNIYATSNYPVVLLATFNPSQYKFHFLPHTSKNNILINNIDPYENSQNNVSGEIKKITIANSDKIVICGDSFSAGIYAIKGKAYINNLGLVCEDWRFENFARSGDSLTAINKRIIDNTAEYNSVLGINDYGGTYAIIMSNANDFLAVYDLTDEQYIDQLDNVVNNVRNLGYTPIVASEYSIVTTNLTRTNYSRRVRALSEYSSQNGILFMDVSSATMNLNYGTNEMISMFPSQHPGVRSNWLFTDVFRKQINVLDRPKQSIKIYRKRADLVVNNIDDLTYFDNYEKIKKYKEIMAGHWAIPDSTKYDILDTSSTNSKINSEYLALQNKESVSFSDYALVDVIVPYSKNNLDSFKLTISDKSAKVYIKSQLDVISTAKRTAFKVGNGVNANAGDVYTYNSTNYTVVDTLGEYLMCSPYKSLTDTSGSLIKVSGGGASTINFTSINGKVDSSLTTYLNKAKWGWIEVINNEGVIEINPTLLKNNTDYDKLSFLIYKYGGFALTDIFAECSGTKEKITTNYKKILPQQLGEEVLSATRFDSPTELAKWDSSRVTTGTFATTNTEDNFIPRGYNGVLELKVGDIISTSITVVPETEVTRHLRLSVWCRRFPAIYNPNTSQGNLEITEESSDVARLIVSTAEGNASKYISSNKDIVGLWWQESVFEITVPTHSSGIYLNISCLDKDIQIARVSAKWL